jgi:hypothetical protein
MAGGGHMMQQRGRRKRTPITRPRAKEAHGHMEYLRARNQKMAARRCGECGGGLPLSGGKW